MAIIKWILDIFIVSVFGLVLVGSVMMGIKVYIGTTKLENTGIVVQSEKERMIMIADGVMEKKEDYYVAYEMAQILAVEEVEEPEMNEVKFYFADGSRVVFNTVEKEMDKF